LELADGVTYQIDDLKPVWKELENRLNVKFNNVYAGNTSAQNEYRYWKNLNFEGVDVVVGNADEMAEDGKTGKIVNLAEYLEYMPNFKKFLDENPIVYLSVISNLETGAIYYAPYFDGYDDIEKYYLMRTDWLEKLLDGEGDFTAVKSDKFSDIIGEAVYEPYMPTSGKLEILSLKEDGSGTETITKDFDTDYGNIIEYMNENVTANTTGVQLVNMLRNYIDEAYGGYYGTKRSNLFAGYNACWMRTNSWLCSAAS
jgi:putative aldouronate transport system substrate-binding protein